MKTLPLIAAHCGVFRTLALTACLLMLSLAGCETLPRIHKPAGLYGSEALPPKIVAADGPLPGKKRQATMRRLRRQSDSSDILESHVALVEAITESPLIAGNKVTLLRDGPETFAAMQRAIKSARDHINLETFIFRDDEVGRPLADLLLAKQAEGVEVNVIYDSYGALKTPDAFFDRMRAGGIRVLEFNPFNPLDIIGKWTLNNRDHRKILVVDGRVAFTGGINFYHVYSRSSSVIRKREEQQKEHFWRDTHIQVEGPAVAAFQSLFLSVWQEQKGGELPARNYFPALQERGDALMRVLGSDPDQEVPHIYAAYISAILHARESIHLTHAYFIPSDEMLKALIQAKDAGVEVKIILPSFSDFWLPFYGGRYYYSDLLKAGVKLYERQGALLHSKTAVIDGVWSTVGSSNLDSRSFMHDAEVNAIILNRDFGRQMEAMFAWDLARSKPVSLEEWEKRSFGERVKEWAARLFKYWL